MPGKCGRSIPAAIAPQQGSPSTPRSRAATPALYGAIDALKATPGRNAIALLSDGADDNGSGKPLSKHTLDDALALARVVNVPVFAIGVGSEIDEPVLKRIGVETGASCLLAPQPSELKVLYAKISEQLAGQYSIQYTSNLPGDGSAHRVQLKSGDATGTKEYQSPVKPAAVLAQKATPATPAAALVKKENSIYGDAIRGGDSYEKAVPLKPGQLYHLDHHQRKNEFDYFVVEARPGHKLTATINTTQKGVSIDGEEATPNEIPYAGIAIHGTQRRNIIRAM